MAIKHWPKQEQPREKLFQNGAAVLSTAELLAIFIQSGTKGQTALDISRQLLQKFGGLQPLFQAEKTEICHISGIGKARYVLLQAALELARRYLEESLCDKNVLESSNDVMRFIKSKLKHCKNEVFACLFLDNSFRIISFEEMFKGTLTKTNIYPREIIKRSLELNAAAVIFSHNHPSGDEYPSEADRQLTLKLKRILEQVDVRLLDHIIIAANKTYSFAEHHLL